jgi:hypothetical protein
LAAIRLLYEEAHERPRACGASQAPAASAELRPLRLHPRPERASAQSRGRVGGGLAHLLVFRAALHSHLPTAVIPAKAGTHDKHQPTRHHRASCRRCRIETLPPELSEQWVAVGPACSGMTSLGRFAPARKFQPIQSRSENR